MAGRSPKDPTYIKQYIAKIRASIDPFSSENIDLVDSAQLQQILNQLHYLIQHSESLTYHNKTLQHKLDNASKRIDTLKKHMSEQSKQMSNLALNDPLTDTLNRYSFREVIEKHLASAKRHNQYLALLHIGIDQFREVNSTYGQATADKLLQQITERLHSRIRKEDELGRIGGDEFGVLLVNTHSAFDAGSIAEKILKCIHQPFTVNNQRLQISASIGIAVYPLAAQKFERLIRCADWALEQAKKSGRNQLKYYSENINRQYAVRLEILQALRHACERGEFYLDYQPQVSIKDEKIIGFEALIRWCHPEHGCHGPQEFIPLAEEAGFIHDIGNWVLDQACCHYADWRQKGYLGNNERMAINLSPLQLSQGSFVQRIHDTLEKYKLPPGLIELELTESSLLEHMELCLYTMEELSNIGVKIAIDDFGTGYSSLQRLQLFPISTLKVDRCFIKDISSQDSHKIILNSILQLGADLDLDIIAEGVENEAQLNFLRERGCQFAQGYYFAKPLGLADIEKLLVTGIMTR